MVFIFQNITITGMIFGRAHLPHSMFNLCEETLSRVKEYLNVGILQMSRYGLNLKLENICDRKFCFLDSSTSRDTLL